MLVRKIFVGSTAPLPENGDSHNVVEVGTLWLDTSATPLLKKCTSIDPWTWTSVEGGESPNTPTAGEKAALAGTTGTPGAANKYVTDSDGRMTNARAPTAHVHATSNVTGLDAALAAKQASSEKGQASGYASLGADGKVPAAQLPASQGGSRFPQAVSLGGYVVVANVGANYDTVAVAKGLGVAVIDFTGVSSIDFRAFVNKVGTGTQSWQLWNVTDGSEIGVINDAGVAGDKVLSATIASGLPTGKKLVRIRAKSTVAADDPVFYGAALELS